jgi:polar amino acid transport system permease protein
VFQATALTLTIAVPEIMNRAYEIGNDTFEYMPVFILAAIFYAIVSIPVSRVVQRLEGR